MKAPFAYYGGKTGMAQQIVELMPPHRVYIEPYFGSGAVFFAKQPAVHEIVNDLDGGVAAFFRALRDDPDELERRCSLSPHSRAEFAACLDPTDDPMEMARRFWVRVNQSFAKTAGHRTGWSVTTSRSQSVPGSILGRLGRFSACAQRLATVSIEQCDAAGLVDRLATSETVVYADPPYLASTRTTGTDYRLDASTDADHQRLAEVLTSTPAAVILSGYASPLYDRLYAGWHRIEIPVNLHASNAVRVARGERTEVLWTNFEPARAVQMGLAL